MFTAAGQAIGVGPDGKHYTPDGEEVAISEPHHDAEGTVLPQETVEAANQVASDVSVAIKVRNRLKGDGATLETVDALGRTFRELTDAKSGTLINADGDKVPLKSARRVENETGKLVDYVEPQPPAPEEPQSFTLVIKVDHEGDEQEIGSVDISGTSTLRDVRNLIQHDLHTDFPDFVFLMNGVPLMKYEEGDRLAKAALPEILIRGKEVKSMEPPKKMFNRKVEQAIIQEEQKRREKQEFEDVMNRVRQGQFLKSVKPTLLE